MAASLVHKYLGTKCHLHLKFAITEPLSPRCVKVNIERVLLPSSGLGNRLISTSCALKSEPSSNKAGSPLSTPSSSGVKAASSASESKGQTIQLDYVYRERYIPITRQSVLRFLLQEKNVFTESEIKDFPSFVIALDSTLVNKYQAVLKNVQTLFDPINPDKDTLKSREWTRNEKLDNEFSLLQQLEDVMKKANFHEVPKMKIDQLLKERKSDEGVVVGVDTSRYDVLRFWVLGQEHPEVHLSLGEKILNKILKRPPREPIEYYKRLVLALRLKKDSKLILKAFKEIPLHRLETLLPNGKIQLCSLDKSILTVSLGLTGLGILAKTVTVLAGMNVDWTLLVSLISGSVAVQRWAAFQRKKNDYIRDISRTLYFKNLANNKGILTLLVDRAEDESLKEAILTYAFLLQSVPEAIRNSATSDGSRGQSKDDLEELVEKWVKKHTGVELEFNSSESIAILKNLGILSEKNGKLQVLSLGAAMRILPQSPPSLITRRATECDITEGYDRDEYLETEEEYKTEERQLRRYGWF